MVQTLTISYLDQSVQSRGHRGRNVDFPHHKYYSDQQKLFIITNSLSQNYLQFELKIRKTLVLRQKISFRLIEKAHPSPSLYLTRVSSCSWGQSLANFGWYWCNLPSSACRLPAAGHEINYSAGEIL